jgi:glycosyltransferase involved in cell wall biosynthesis
MTRRRVAVIGPVPPIRSGVARHTAATAQALAQLADVRLWSFSRQYWDWLYPGSSERSPDLHRPEGLSIQSGLDGMNPLSWQRTASQVAQWQPDVAVIPAWTFFLAPALGIMARHLRRRGVPVCAIVHNAADHEAAWWKQRLSRWQLAQADRYVTHNEALADAVRDVAPGAPVAIFTHPVFDDFPPPRGTLPRQASVELLFYGLVRPYKGLDIAIDALALCGRRDVRLTIAGEFWLGEEQIRAQITRLGLADRIEIRPGHVSDAETAELFARADAVVLPYRAVSGSGIVPLACRYGRAVIASDLPGLASTIEHGRTGWLFPAGDAHALGRLLAGLDRQQTTMVGRQAMEFGKTLTWERFVRHILQ